MMPGTGTHKHVLSAESGGDSPTPVPGAETTFSLGSLPLEKDGLCLYPRCIDITVQGTLTQDNGNGSRIYADAFKRALIAAISVRDCFIGTPVGPANLKGAYLHSLEFVANGYRFRGPLKGAFPEEDGTYPFTARISVPLSLGLGRTPAHTANPSLAYRDGILGVTFAAETVLDSISEDATLSDLKMKATVISGLEPEIRFGIGVEFADYTATASADESQEAKFLGLGNKTGLEGVENRAGLVWAMLGGTTNGMAGPIDVSKIIKLGIPFRGQREINDVAAWLADAWDVQESRPIGSTQDSGGNAGELYDASGHPYVMGASTGLQRTQTADDDTLLGIEIVKPSKDMKLTEIQTVGEDATLDITANDEPDATKKWHLLVLQIKVFSKAKRQAFAEMAVKSGLVQKVIGTTAELEWRQKFEDKNRGQVESKKTRYLTWRMVSKARRGREIAA